MFFSIIFLGFDLYIFIFNIIYFNGFSYRKGGSANSHVHDDFYASVLHQYLKYDGEMSVVMVLWRDCEQLLEKYNDEQVSAEGI